MKKLLFLLLLPVLAYSQSNQRVRYQYVGADTLQSNRPGSIVVNDTVKVLGYIQGNNIEAASGDMVAIRDTLRTSGNVVVGSLTVPPLSIFHVKTHNAPPTMSNVIDLDYYVFTGVSEDAVIGLFSKNEGGHGSALDLAEVDSVTGALRNKWGVGRYSSQSGGHFYLSWGDTSSYYIPTPLFTIDTLGKVFTTKMFPITAESEADQTITITRASAAAGDASSVVSKRSRGTLASPTQVLAGDALVGLYGSGLDDNATYSNFSGAFRVVAAENFVNATADYGTYLDFGTTSIGSNSRGTRMFLAEDGSLTVGSTRNLAGLGALTVTNNMLFSSNVGSVREIYRNDSTGQMVIRGDTLNSTAGAWQTYYARAHATQAGNSLLNVNSFSIRSLSGGTTFATFTSTGLSVTADVAVNGGDLTSTATTFNLLNATVTTGNLFGAGTAITIGATTGTASIRNANLDVSNSVADTSAFVTTATRLAIFITGALSTDKYVVSHRNLTGTETLPVAGDQLSYYAKADSLIILRAAGTTSGQKVSYIRIR